MNIYKNARLALMIITVVYCSTLSAAAVNIALVDLELVFVEYKHTQESDEILRSEKEKKQKSLTEFEEKVKNMKDAYDTKRSSLSDSEKSTEEEKLQTELDNLQRVYQKFTEELKDLNDDLIDRIRGEIQSAIELVGKQGQFDIILQKEAVLSGGTDITDRVIKHLNDNYKSKQ